MLVDGTSGFSRVAGAAIDDDPLGEFSRHGRDPRFAGGRMTILLLVGALFLVAAVILLVIVL